MLGCSHRQGSCPTCCYCHKLKGPRNRPPFLCSIGNARGPPEPNIGPPRGSAHLAAHERENIGPDRPPGILKPFGRKICEHDQSLVAAARAFKTGIVAALHSACLRAKVCGLLPHRIGAGGEPYGPIYRVLTATEQVAASVRVDPDFAPCFSARGQAITHSDRVDQEG